MTDQLLFLADRLAALSGGERTVGDFAEGSILELRIDGTPFLIVQEPDEPDTYMIYARVGVPDSSRASEMMALLLRANLANARSIEATYGLEESSEEIVCAMKRRIERTEIPDLLRALEAIATQARGWRDRRLIETA